MSSEIKNPTVNGKPKGMYKGFIHKVAFTKNGKIFIEPMRVNSDNTPQYLVDHMVKKDGATYLSHMQAIPLRQYNKMLMASGDSRYVLKNHDAVLRAYHQQMQRMYNDEPDNRSHKTTFYYAPRAEMINDDGDPIGLSANATYLPVAKADLVMVDGHEQDNDADIDDPSIDNQDSIETVANQQAQDAQDNAELQSSLARIRGLNAEDLQQNLEQVLSSDAQTATDEQDDLFSNQSQTDDRISDALDISNSSEIPDSLNTSVNSTFQVTPEQQQKWISPDSPTKSAKYTPNVANLSTDDFNKLLKQRFNKES